MKPCALGLLWLCCFLLHASWAQEEDADDPPEVVTGEGEEDEPKCEQKCFPWEDSVCARNSQGEVSTFYSPCYMEVFNCENGKDYQQVDMKICQNPWPSEDWNTTEEATTVTV